jgi:redox-sensitive bicupin YhaK (pirin superfamily)
VSLALPDGHNVAVLVLRGRLSVNGSRAAEEAELVVLHRLGSNVDLDVQAPSRILIMSGEPIEEPIARYGPFVMNTREELMQAVQDYQAGRMGHVS